MTLFVSAARWSTLNPISAGPSPARSECEYRLDYDHADPAKPYKRARALVRRAHPLYTELVGAMRHNANGYNLRILTITKHRHNDAADTIADLILQLR
jgi:hypothetical protein